MALVRVTVTLPRDLVRRADAVARKRAASRSAVLAQALAAHVGPEPAAAGTESFPHALSDEALVAELRRRLASDRGTAPSGGTGSVPRLTYDQMKLADVCRRHGVSRLSLFGSVLTDDFGPRSDIDILVEFAPGRTPGLAIMDLEDELSAVFGGRRVDLVTERSLHRLIRDRVRASAVVQYAAG